MMIPLVTRLTARDPFRWHRPLSLHRTMTILLATRLTPREPLLRRFLAGVCMVDGRLLWGEHRRRDCSTGSHQDSSVAELLESAVIA